MSNLRQGSNEGQFGASKTDDGERGSGSRAVAYWVSPALG